MRYHLHPLPNGVTLALAPMPHMTSVSVGFWIGIGGRHEPAALSGISHFIEHMLFKGTRRRSAREISQAVEGIGGYLNAFTSEEHTCFYSKARHDRLADLLDVLADMLLESRFAPADLATERDVIKEEIAMYLDQPQQHVQEVLNAITWPDHPLGRPLTGTEASVDALTRSQLQTYHARHYVAGTTVMAVAGRFELRPTIARLTRLARHWPTGARPESVPATWRQAAPVVRFVTRRAAQTQLALGLRTCARHDERRFALRLLNILLGENMSSRLFQEIREETGLAYSIYSSLSFFADAGDLVISAGLEPENLLKAVRLIVRELRRFKAEAPGAAEFRRARDYALGQIDLSLENTESQMLNLGEQVLGYRTVVPPEVTKRRLARVTPAEIRAVARKFFQPGRLNLALVTPTRQEPRLAAALNALAD